MLLKSSIQKRQFCFGDCIPESKKIYTYFKNKGYNPEMVEGWVEIDRNIDILPDDDFLYYCYPDEYEKVHDIKDYNNYPKGIQHTWVSVNGHIIDITKNQFDKYASILKYIELERYTR